MIIEGEDTSQLTLNIKRILCPLNFTVNRNACLKGQTESRDQFHFKENYRMLVFCMFRNNLKRLENP